MASYPAYPMVDDTSSGSTVRRFSVDEDDVDSVLADLGRRARLQVGETVVVDRTVLDTFDWRLHRSGTWLEHESSDAESVLVWRSAETGEMQGRVAVDEVPSMAGDLPEGPAAERLGPLLDIRALIPLAGMSTRRTTLPMLDDLDKTVARLLVERSTTTGGDPLAATLSVHPVRGYGAAARELEELLAAQERLSPQSEDPLDEVLRRAGHEPGAYTGKLRLRLDPAGSALDAFVEVLRALLDAMRVNEPGVREDLDSEFLHDFRVAVRRTRSILGQARGVLAPDVLDWVRPEMAWLGQVTGPTRDFDVYLLELPAFEAALPPARRADLAPFGEYLAARQGAAHAELVDALDSERYELLVERWSAELESPTDGGDATPDASRAARPVAGDRIWRSFRRVIRDGRAIAPSSPPEDLHELRKDAKKFRYALECFGSLFPPEEVGAVVRDLKVLQDVLGEYQDCQVQIGSLGRFGQEMLDRGTVQASALLAMGSIIELLEEREARAREEFDERFAAFDTKDLRGRMRDTFRPADGGET